MRYSCNCTSTMHEYLTIGAPCCAPCPHCGEKIAVTHMQDHVSEAHGTEEDSDGCNEEVSGGVLRTRIES